MAYAAGLNDCADTVCMIGQQLSVPGFGVLDPARTSADSLLLWAEANGTELTNMEIVQESANLGDVVIGGLRSDEMLTLQAHGHVVTAVPGELTYSRSFGRRVPQVMNSALNAPDKAFRSKGASFAFSAKRHGFPRFFLIKR